MSNEGEQSSREYWNQLLEDVNFGGLNPEQEQRDLWRQLLRGINFSKLGVPLEFDYIQEIPDTEYLPASLQIFLSKPINT